MTTFYGEYRNNKLDGVLGISTSQFGLVVSAYAFSAGASGLCAAGFADKFLSMIMVIFYTHLGPNPLWVVILTNIVLYTGISSRMIASSALISGVPDMKDRGVYMGINSSIQQVSGGIASFVAGLIVYQPTKNAPLQHFDTVGYVTACTMLITLGMMFFIDREVSKKLHAVHA